MVGEYTEQLAEGVASLMDVRRLQVCVHAAVSRFPDRVALMLRKRFGLDGGGGCTLVAVGKELGVSPERVRQMEAKALRLLRKPKNARELRALYLSELYLTDSFSFQGLPSWGVWFSRCSCCGGRGTLDLDANYVTPLNACGRCMGSGQEEIYAPDWRCPRCRNTVRGSKACEVCGRMRDIPAWAVLERLPVGAGLPPPRPGQPLPPTGR